MAAADASSENGLTRADQLLVEYMQRLDAGEQLSVTEFLLEHADVAQELAEYFQAAERVASMAGLTSAEVTNGAAEHRQHPADPALPRRFGEYELLHEIARGGMGVVFKARHIKLNRVVALKMILAGPLADHADVGRFMLEALAAARLQHPNIVSIHEVGQVEGQHYFTMDYVEGSSLAALIRDHPLPAVIAAKYVRTIAEAVHHAHQRGIIHRDLKPTNVLIDAADQPRVMDFGLAKRLEDDSKLTATGTAVGTASYMPPEQASGKYGRIGPASDVYSLGAVLYALLTGRPPFQAETQVETVLQMLDEEPVAPRLLNRKVPRDLEIITLKCLEKESDKRYASAHDLAEDLRRFLEHRPINAHPVGTIEWVLRWCRRRPARAALLLVSVIATALLVGSSMWFNRQLSEDLSHIKQAREDLQLALTRQIAERIDRDLEQLARIPHMSALAWEERPGWDEPKLRQWLLKTLEQDRTRRLYGTCCAFEPGQFRAAQLDFALYAYRSNGKLETKQLLAPEYKNYRKWAWYRNQEGWSEPFFDRGGGNIWMVTYTVPLKRDGKFVGVMTADLSVTYFERLRKWMDELKLGDRAYGFVISQEGTLLSHPNPLYRMPTKLFELEGFKDSPAAQELSRQIRQRKADPRRPQDPWTEIVRDPWTQESSRFLFAPVASSGWYFIAVVPTEALPPTMRAQR